MATDFESSLGYAKSHLGVTFELKDKQLETLKLVFDGKDCVSVLPTGYGKSVIFQLLPWLLKKHRPVDGVVLVVSPLNALMQDQVMSLCDKGIKACFLNSQGTVGKTFKMVERHIDHVDADVAGASGDAEEQFEEEEDDDGERDIHAPCYVKFDDLKKCQYNLVYAHPETLLKNKHIGKMLRSKTYQERVYAVVIDEVHMISEWGPSFRTSFKSLGELTCIFPEASHLAVTATATTESVKELASDLQYTDFGLVRVNPDRPNIYLKKQIKPPNIRKYEKLDSLIKPIAEELKAAKTDFPLTIVYINNDEALGYCYQYVAHHLGHDAYVPRNERIPENRISAQYHKQYTEEMKSHIVMELRKEKPKLRLVLATVALGMGLNAPCIRRVVHFQPPTTLEKYFQEIGRAGRDGQSAQAILYYNNSDIAKNRKGITQSMIDFCNNKDRCLRQQLISYFGFTTVVFSGEPSDCCSNCIGV